MSVISEAWITRLTAPPATFGASDTGLRRRLRLLAGCLFLAAVAFNMAPGMLIAETKLDMPINPIGFLSQALNMWDQDYLGHLQNQAYGYIFPMGPFYTLLINAGMPPWVVQRLWVTLILCVAFVGVAQVARALRIGGQLAGVLAGLAYALAPHAQALMGFNSVEFAPSAVLPWVLLFLIRGARGETSPRRAACLSALAFLCAGGINAAAELAVLVVPMIYLLTRARGPRKRRLIAWWLAAIAAVSFWWLVPLVMLGRYVFSFMPFTENAWTTTVVGSLTNVLRGMNSWVAFLPVDGRPFLPAAYEHATTPWLVLVTALVAGLGLAGLTLARTPERAFLLLTTLVGVAILVAGHAGPLAEPLRALLDGPLAPFRNLHKFNALVRLPLVLGLAALVSYVGARRAVVRLPVAVAGAGLVGLTLVPVAAAGIAPSGAFADVPEHWRQAASWLDDRADQGTVLVLPGARRGEYTWGRPLDEPFQPLLKKARWVSNTIVPWGTAGSNRLVKAIDDRFANGQGSEGLTQALRRMGVRYLLIRNDLDRVAFGDAWPARVHEALDRSPGLNRVRGFGPTVGFEDSSTGAGWLDQPYTSLEIYEVAGARPVVGTVAAERPAAGLRRPRGAAHHGRGGRPRRRPAGDPRRRPRRGRDPRRRHRPHRHHAAARAGGERPAQAVRRDDDARRALRGPGARLRPHRSGVGRPQDGRRLHRDQGRHRLLLAVQARRDPRNPRRRAAAVRRGGLRPAHRLALHRLEAAHRAVAGGPVHRADLGALDAGRLRTLGERGDGLRGHGGDRHRQGAHQARPHLAVGEAERPAGQDVPAPDPGHRRPPRPQPPGRHHRAVHPRGPPRAHARGARRGAGLLGGHLGTGADGRDQPDGHRPPAACSAPTPGPARTGCASWARTDTPSTGRSPSPPEGGCWRAGPCSPTSGWRRPCSCPPGASRAPPPPPPRATSRPPAPTRPSTTTAGPSGTPGTRTWRPRSPPNWAGR
ncbi:hypothetical protein GCM10018952_24540 [Streptosporangium vulgare]